MTHDIINLGKHIELLNQLDSQAAQQRQALRNQANAEERFDGILLRLERVKEMAMQRKYKREQQRKAQRSQTSFLFL